MPVDYIDYFWGLFDDPEAASAEMVGKRLRFDSPAIPDAVLASFSAERIGELEGEYGVPDIGDPTEIDCLEFSADGKKSRIRVVNRGLALFTAATPEVEHLHRFFCILRQQDAR